MHNLPPPAFQGIAEYVVSVEIDAPLDNVWAIVTDLKSYPLCRSAIIVDDSSHKPTEDQSLRAEATLELAMQMPPSLETSKKPTVGYEHVGLVDHATHRVTWGGGRVPNLFRAEHSHALSATGDGKTLCETRHVFGGLSGYPIKCFMSRTMRQCLEDMLNALKQRAETQSD
ncbi:hypothetical protein LXA43DRAFT_1062686 [Ganoderma leucocontextum]|nr:hypothetical protein LXA43DRAFT_1062686 [Ganoderma leucocontextum]